MNEILYKVFAKTDEHNCITDIWSTGNQALGDKRTIEEMQELGYVKIDEGSNGQIYGHAQVNYLKIKYGKDKYDENRLPNFKYDDEIKEVEPTEKEEWFIKPQRMAQEKANQEAMLQTMMLRSRQVSFLAELPDEEVIKVKLLFDAWEDDPDKFSYEDGMRRTYNNGLWKCEKAHEKQESWYPGADPTLWTQLDKDEHKGTQGDPILVPDSVTTSGFEYVIGKYYIEGEDVYVCKREGMSDGETIKLFYKPSQQTPHYFEEIMI